MSIEERAEALDSLELLDVKHKVDWLERIQSSNKITDNSTLKSIPNKKSLRPLFDDKGKNIRGAVCLYSDLSKNLAFVDIDIAPELQELYFG
jgi:hypothetical protein